MQTLIKSIICIIIAFEMCPRAEHLPSVVFIVLKCESVFEIQLRYCIHFWTNTHGKNMNHINARPSMRKIVLELLFYKNGFGIR